MKTHLLQIRPGFRAERTPAKGGPSKIECLTWGLTIEAQVQPLVVDGEERANLFLRHCTYHNVPCEYFRFIDREDESPLDERPSSSNSNSQPEDHDTADPYQEEVRWKPGHSRLDYEKRRFCKHTAYEQCAHCDHFIERQGTAGLVRHLDDGEQRYNHDAAPSGEVRTFAEWLKRRPNLFVLHSDGKIGPNSALHGTRRGKIDLWDH